MYLPLDHRLTLPRLDDALSATHGADGMRKLGRFVDTTSLIVVLVAIPLVLLSIQRSAYGLLAGVLGAAFAILAGRAYRAQMRRAAWRRPMPTEWRAILERKVRYYRTLDPDGRGKFERNVQRILSEHVFESVSGAVLTDEVRLLTASAAAMLVHGWEEGVSLPSLRTILVYPDHFDDDYAISTRGDVAGMVHSQGPVIVSERALSSGFARPDDGHNVAIHEFAHVLDFTDGFADGVPGGLPRSAIAAWSSLLDREMKRLEEGHSVLREYASTNRAELFAVAVENFFERPSLLEERHPELYRALATLFRQDPAKRLEMGVGASGATSEEEEARAHRRGGGD